MHCNQVHWMQWNPMDFWQCFMGIELNCMKHSNMNVIWWYTITLVWLSFKMIIIIIMLISSQTDASQPMYPSSLYYHYYSLIHFVIFCFLTSQITYIFLKRESQERKKEKMGKRKNFHFFSFLKTYIYSFSSF